MKKARRHREAMTFRLLPARIRICVPVLLQTLLFVLLYPRWNAVGQTQAPEDPCSYRLPHYEEDWSCVRSPFHSADSLDTIKYLALGEDEDSYVSFGGEIREAYERYHNPNFGLQPQDSAGYLLQRYLVHVEIHRKALPHDFSTFVGGHVTRLGDRSEVELSLEFVTDLQKTAGRALNSFSLAEFAKTNASKSKDKWDLHNEYKKAIVDRCYGELLARWEERLADSTTYLRDNCWAMMESVIVTLPPEANQK